MAIDKEYVNEKGIESRITVTEFAPGIFQWAVVCNGRVENSGMKYSELTGDLAARLAAESLEGDLK